MTEKQNINIVKWNEDITKAPSNESVLVMYKDDTGDNTNIYTIPAWRLDGTQTWISNDEQICTMNIIYWATFPEYEAIVKI